MLLCTFVFIMCVLIYVSTKTEYIIEICIILCARLDLPRSSDTRM